MRVIERDPLKPVSYALLQFGLGLVIRTKLQLIAVEVNHFELPLCNRDVSRTHAEPYEHLLTLSFQLKLLCLVTFKFYIHTGEIL